MVGFVSVVVVLPTYNERATVGPYVRAVLDRPLKPDVIVVDDSSPDGTGAAVQDLARDFPGRVRLLTRPGKAGLARAYAAGFAAALAEGQYDVVVQMDVDGSHAPADIDRLTAALDSADLALGSRYVAGGDVSGWTKGREWLSRSGNTYARLLLGSPIRDLTGGFKAWRADLLATLDPSSTRNDGYGFQIEMTIRAARAGARIVELPIVFRDREVGESKMSGRIALEALISVPRLRRSGPEG
jgi:dolichol-phosphate mannosyltransferase